MAYSVQLISSYSSDGGGDEGAHGNRRRVIDGIVSTSRPDVRKYFLRTMDELMNPRTQTSDVFEKREYANARQQRSTICNVVEIANLVHWRRVNSAVHIHAA